MFDHLIMDAKSYWQWSDRIAAGDWWGDSVFYQAPLYPYFLGLLKCAGADLAAVRTVQIILGSFACGGLFIIGRVLFGRRAGVAAGALLALYPPAIFFDAIIQKAGLGLVWIILLLGTLVLLRRSRRPWAALAAGASLGLLMLTREESILLAPVLLAWTAFGAGARGRAERTTLCAAFLVGLAIPLAPVAWRNYRVGGEFVLTTAQAGPNFYIGNNPFATGVYMPLRPGRSNTSFERTDAVALAEQAAGRKLSASEVSDYWVGKAFDFIRREPAAWGKLMARKSALLVNAYEVPDAENQYFYERYSPLLRLLSLPFHLGTLLPLGVLGIALIRPWRGDASVLLLVLATLAAAVVAFYVFGRYRYTIVPPLALLAGAGLARALQTVGERRWRELAVPVAAAAFAAVASNWPMFARAEHLAESFSNAGVALAEAGDDARALNLYAEALRLRPDMPETLCNAAVGHALLGRPEQALRLVRQALRIRPNDPRIEMQLGTLLAERGAEDEGILHLQRAVELGPQDVDSRSNYLALLTRRGRWVEAVEQMHAIVALRPDDPGALSNLAWMLATCPDPAVRDGPSAVRAAESALRLGGLDDPALLDILAAAYARSGRFEDAVRTAESARSRAAGRNLTDLVRQIESRLEHYRQRRAIPPA